MTAEAEFTFQECVECYAKPGAPSLCAACLNNRTAINELSRFRDGIYGICARSFGTTREDAKKRITGTLYGAYNPPLASPTLIGWTWRSHLEDLHDNVQAARWLDVSRKLALMLSHALDKMRKESER